MPTDVSRTSKGRSRTILIMLSILALTTAAQGAAPAKKGKKSAPPPAAKAATVAKPQAAEAPTPASQAPAALRDWGPYLDVAYELTYWSGPEIKEWREKREKEIGEPLAAYISNWSGKLAPPVPEGGTVQKPEPQAGYRERDQLRLMIAQTVDYLQSDNRDSLNGALKQLEKLKGKAAMPEIAFWSGYVGALQALEENDSAKFAEQVYGIWNNAIAYIEQGALSGVTKEASVPFYYRNMVNLIVNRAIIERKMDGLNALGPLVLMLKERDIEGTDGDGRYLAALVQRINESFVAPDTDRYRLNFSVAYIESKRLQQHAAAMIDSGGMTEEARKEFEKARQFNDLALKWAASLRSCGVVAVTADYLDSTSFAIQRLPDNEKAAAYGYFSLLPAQDGSTTLLKAMAIFNDVATYGDGGWKKAGYGNREVYLKSMHRFWRSIMELSLWSGDYYLAKLNKAGDQQAILKLSSSMQVPLDSYLDFLAVQESRKFTDTIPDSAYFGAAEAAEKLAYAYQRANTYSTDSSAYNFWFLHRLQATELFPFDVREIARTAETLKRDGRYNLYLDYFLPLSGRIKQSTAIMKWLEEQPADTAAPVRDYVASIDEIFSAVPATGGQGAPKAATRTQFEARFGKLREELQRKPDHPLHRLLRAFYVEEAGKNTSYTLLLKDTNRLNLGM